MVHMSNQETNVSTGRFAPNVTYAQNVRAPIPEVQSPRINDKIDWGRAVSDVAGMVGKGFEAYQKKKAADADAAIEQRKQQDLNNLALEFNKISEDQRQGRLSPSAADTRMRALTMNAIAGGLSEEDVYNVGKRHGYQIQSLEADRQKMIMTADEKAIDAQIDNLIARNDSYKSMKKSDVRAIIDQKNFEIDNMAKYQQQMNLLDPASEDYQRLKAYRDQAFQNNATMNMLEFVSNLYANHEGPITPEAYQAITNAGIDFGVSKDMSRDEASLSMDLVMQRIGLKGDVSRYLHGQQFLTEEKENAIKYMMVSEKARALNIPGAITLMALGGQEAERLIATEFSNENPAVITNVVNQIYGLVKNPEGKMAAADTLKESNIPFMMGAVNNVHSSAHSPYMRGAISTTGVELFNKHNKVRPGMSQEELQIVINNTDGTRGAISLRQIEQTAKTLENSADPVEQELGVQLKKDIIEMDANEVAATMLLDNFIHRDSVRSLMEGPLKDQLRVNKNGELFVRTPERVVYDENKTPLELFVEVIYGSKESHAVSNSDLSTALVGSSGQVVDNLGKINTYLSRLDPEVRKQTLMDLGVAEQGANDEPYEFFTTSMFGKAVDTVKDWVKPLNTPIAQLKGKVSDKEMSSAFGGKKLRDYGDTSEEFGAKVFGRRRPKNIEDEAIKAGVEASRQTVPGYKGNIDILNRPEIQNEDGTFSTIESVSIYDDREGKHVLIPTIKVIDGVPERMSIDEAENWYYGTGEHLGMFNTPEEATEMGEKISKFKGKQKLTSSATTRSSETLANAKVVMAGDEGEAEDYKNVPDERVAEKEELNAKVKALKEALDKTDDVYDREYLKDAIQHYGRELQMLETGEQHSRASVSSSTPLAFAKLSGEAKTNEQIWEEHANKHSEERNLNKAQTRNYKELWGKLEKDIRKMREENPATLFHVEPKLLEERFLNILIDKGSDAAYKHLRSWKRLIEEAKKWNDGDDVQVYLNNEGELVIGTVKPKGPNAVKGE